jgi:hypothetical protein
MALEVLAAAPEPPAFPLAAAVRDGAFYVGVDAPAPPPAGGGDGPSGEGPSQPPAGAAEGAPGYRLGGALDGSVAAAPGEGSALLGLGQQLHANPNPSWVSGGLGASVSVDNASLTAADAAAGAGATGAAGPGPGPGPTPSTGQLGPFQTIDPALGQQLSSVTVHTQPFDPHGPAPGLDSHSGVPRPARAKPPPPAPATAESSFALKGLGTVDVVDPNRRLMDMEAERARNNPTRLVTLDVLDEVMAELAEDRNR